jgi:hypothetical protein
MPDTYTRKISAEEAAEGHIMVLKNRLKFFPPIGDQFELLDSAGRSVAKVEARDCTCRGPELPHQHYFIRHAGLNKGAKITLSRDGAAYRVE